LVTFQLWITARIRQSNGGKMEVVEALALVSGTANVKLLATEKSCPQDPNATTAMRQNPTCILPKKSG
jgi:hypothetical protein